MTDSFKTHVILGFLLVGAWLTWNWPLLTMESVGRLGPGTRGGNWPSWESSPRSWRRRSSVAGLRLWQAGDYESQPYFWRSAPPGIDVAALALGNPIGVLNGGWTRHLRSPVD